MNVKFQMIWGSQQNIKFKYVHEGTAGHVFFKLIRNLILHTKPHTHIICVDEGKIKNNLRMIFQWDSHFDFAYPTKHKNQMRGRR